jgi:sigma-B regulation protein RsbU (phosphoserine phosphatase)
MVMNIVVREGILREEELRASYALENAEQHINGVFIAVETAVKNHANEIRQNLNAPHEEMYRITREMLETNPMIVGSAIAFEPNYYPDQGRWFSPYSYRDVTSAEEQGTKTDYVIHEKQLGNSSYDYHNKEWYQTPRNLKQGYWSEPYCDTGGGEITMITYSYPLQDEQGNVFAVVTADVSLEWLSQLMDSLKYYDQSYSFVLSRNGTFITHPRTEVVLNQTIFSFAESVGDSAMAKIGEKMVAGKMDMEPMRSPRLGKAFIFFKPVKHTGWSMAMVCGTEVFFRTATRAGILVGTLILLMLLILTFIMHKGVKRLTLPLALFTQAVDEVAHGNLQATLPPIHTKDEMLRLRNSFCTMQKSLTQQMEELKRVNEQKGRIESELKIASNIQRAMLPKTFPPYPDRDDIDIYGQLTPAKEVGGDLFDFYIHDEKLFFCIGDVSGKGVPASLVMAVMRSLFRTLSAHEHHPERIISQMNDRMAENNEESMFVTLFIGVLDLPTGKLRYCNAGHNAPLLLTEKDNKKQMTFLPCDNNIPVGVIDGWKFSLQEMTVDTNTTIFLYTDGLTEAENVEHQLFGEERMKDAIVFATSQEIVDRMTDAVHAFTGDAEQSDDLTMLAIRYSQGPNTVCFHQKITLSNDVKQVPLLSEFVDNVCESLGFDAATTMQMNLALEEAVVNVMNYAYPPETHGDIYIMAEADEKRLKFTISDNGMPFDPTAHHSVDTTLSAEERPIGGLGIHLITQLMDSVNYERKNNKNVLTLRKKLPQMSHNDELEIRS